MQYDIYRDKWQEVVDIFFMLYYNDINKDLLTHREPYCYNGLWGLKLKK
jgi:hypothetical protein